MSWLEFIVLHSNFDPQSSFLFVAGRLIGRVTWPKTHTKGPNLHNFMSEISSDVDRTTPMVPIWISSFKIESVRHPSRRRC